MNPNDLFFDQVKDAARQCGFTVEDVPEPFNGAIKPHVDLHHFAYFNQDGKSILVKTYHEDVVTDLFATVIAQYINLSETPYDTVFIVCNNRLLAAIEPYIEWLVSHHCVFNHVYVVNMDIFENVLK